MGLFTWVKPDNAILPVGFKNLTGWQTKDVVECEMETLEITGEGELVSVWHEYEWVDIADAPLGWYMKQTQEHRSTLDYHGDMTFYTGRDRDGNDSQLVELVARFSNGKLQCMWLKNREEI